MRRSDRNRLKQQAIMLRTERRLSYSEISEEIGVAKSTLHGWLKDIPLTDKEKYNKWYSKAGNENKILKLIHPPVVQKNRTSICEVEGQEFESLRVVHDTNRIGDISVSISIAYLLQIGYEIFIPFGSHLRYDILAEKDGKYLRVQVKTGRIRKGTLYFSGCSTPYISSAKKCVAKPYNSEEIDHYSVYCPDNQKVYFIPIGEFSGNIGRFRVDPMPHTNGDRPIKWAISYEI